MSLFGKFMAVLNFLGVIAIFTFALLGYSKRTAWQYAVYRHDLYMYGLPVHKEVEDDQGQEYLRYLDLGDPEGTTLKELFPSNPVKTQVEEVERVKASLDGKLSAISGREAQMVFLADTLLPLAQTNTDRENLIAIHTYCADPQKLKQLEDGLQNAFKLTPTIMAAKNVAYPAAFDDAVRAQPAPYDPKNPLGLVFFPAVALPNVPKMVFTQPADPKRPFDEAFVGAMTNDAKSDFKTAFETTLNAVNTKLRQQYDDAFQEALKGRGGQASSQEMQKHAIAHLLFSLDDSLPKDAAFDADAFNHPAFKRLITVVGVKEANREMNEQAFALVRMIQELERELERDRSTFAGQHEQAIGEAMASAQVLALQTEELKRLKAKVEAQTTVVAERQKNFDDLTNELAARRQYTAQLIANVRQITDGITQKRIEVRDAATLNQEYEKKIRELESKR